MINQGTIIKALAGFYYVHIEGAGVYACRGRGLFRKEQIHPLVGDRVGIEITHEGDKEGNVTEILPRRNALIRPSAANVDQALVISSMADPKPSFLLLDAYLANMEALQIPSVVCFNKTDLVTEEESRKAAEIYENAGYPVFRICARSREGVDALKICLSGKTSVVVGPSGAGKSTLANALQSAVVMETGEISKKLARGKNTTRHCELIPLDGSGYLVDAPGFSAYELYGIESRDLKDCFQEFTSFAENCYYRSCMHDAEPDCGVKEAVGQGKIGRSRYENYLNLLSQLKEKEKRKY